MITFLYACAKRLQETSLSAPRSSLFGVDRTQISVWPSQGCFWQHCSAACCSISCSTGCSTAPSMQGCCSLWAGATAPGMKVSHPPAYCPCTSPPTHYSPALQDMAGHWAQADVVMDLHHGTATAQEFLSMAWSFLKPSLLLSLTDWLSLGYSASELAPRGGSRVTPYDLSGKSERPAAPPICGDGWEQAEVTAKILSTVYQQSW